MFLALILVALAIHGAVLVGTAVLWLPFVVLVWLPARLLQRLFRRGRAGLPSSE